MRRDEEMRLQREGKEVREEAREGGSEGRRKRGRDGASLLSGDGGGSGERRCLNSDQPRSGIYMFVTCTKHDQTTRRRQHGSEIRCWFAP